VRRPFSAVVVFGVFGLIPFSFYAYRPFSMIHDDLENCLEAFPYVGKGVLVLIAVVQTMVN